MGQCINHDAGIFVWILGKILTNPAQGALLRDADAHDDEQSIALACNDESVGDEQDGGRVDQDVIVVLFGPGEKLLETTLAEEFGRERGEFPGPG